MKPSNSIIRWKFVVPAGILFAATAVFFTIFFDGIAERMIEMGASTVNGARVEIDGFKTKFFKGSMEIARLQVTDREHPMQNVVETAGMVFQISPAEALKKRAVINDASIHGLRFNTERKTSGAMPRLEKRDEAGEPPGPAARLAEKYKERFKVSLAGMKGEVKERIEFDPKDTQIVKQSQELKEKADTLPKEWEGRITTLDAENRLKTIEADLQSIKQTPTKGTEALTAVPAALKKLKESRDALQKLKDDVRTTKESITGDISNYKKGVASLPNAKKQDIDNLMSRLNLDFANPERLMEGMIGPMVLQRFQTVLKYVEVARKHMPSKKEKESVPARPRLAGMDITFPTPAAPPRFWLMKAGLDGTYQDIAAKGALTNLASDPARVGKPFRMDLNGARGSQRYMLQATLDHAGEVPKDSFVVRATGIDLATVTGGDSLSALSGGTAAADIAFSVIGEGALGGQIGVSMTGVKLDSTAFMKTVGVPAGANLSTEDQLKANFASNVIKAVEAMPQVTVQAQLFGTWNDPSIKLTSNLTGALGDVIKSSLGNAAKEQRAQLEARLNDVMAKEKAQLDAKGAELQSKVDQRLKSVEADIEKKISEASGIDLGSGGGSPVKLPSLKKIFK
jgi:uncharacterized protein (TIGR03545 family)